MAGVKIPKFQQMDVGSDTKMNLTGLGAGGQQVQATRKVQHRFALSRECASAVCAPTEGSAQDRALVASCQCEYEPSFCRLQAFMTSVKLLVELASLQTAFLTLDEAIKTTNRRVNALDNVVRPKLENTIAYIKVRCLAPGSKYCVCQTIVAQLDAACAGVICASLLVSQVTVRAALDLMAETWVVCILQATELRAAGLYILPRVLWVQGELDELEREEFFRLKKVQNKKQRDADVS